ncbi:hypothetical protein [Nitratireductor pacificus]|uniref:Uncharacterized protein n=1 Tax=Nitratireductor pacificus pht-3B TaxID=391937 RepID=K2MHL5_9HYPH|nr:hypothetical protein [Nitratireductor pacificus]EKF20230.1 hypothetical protein NA2_03212 [Nitratireductor pacificus pht-3B]
MPTRSLIALSALALALPTLPAAAAPSCGQIQAQAAAPRGATIRYPSPTGSGMTLYDRFVTRGAACMPGYSRVPRSIPAADTANCRVFVCAIRNDD